MNISLVHSSSISKINSPYIYFGTSYKNILKLKKESNYPIIKYEDELNKIGTFIVEVNFHTEVKAKISIKIDKIKSK